MSGIEQQSVRLPPELLLHIAKYLDGEEHSLSLALSDAFDGFASLYGINRRRHGLFISHKCFFLTPGSWHTYFSQHISPEFLTSFSANGCYWLPGQQIFQNILKMKNLHELAVNDTKVTIAQLSRVLETCQEINKLDFSYQHLPGLENGNDQFATSAVRAAFKKLVSLKVSTSVSDAKDYVNDPWFFIIKLWSWCGDCCSDLTVEISYDGETWRYSQAVGEEDVPLQTELQRRLREDLLPNMEWMATSLRSITLLQLGPAWNFEQQIRSRLLDNLFYWMFSEKRRPQSLSCIWISDFYFPHELIDSVLLNAPQLKVFRAINHPEDLEFLIGKYSRFRDVEIFGGLRFLPLDHLHKLKTAYGYFDVEFSKEYEMLTFFEAHPNLEHLGIYYCCNANFSLINFVSNATQPLLRLKSFSYCGDVIPEEMMWESAKMYPNIQALHLYNTFDPFERNSVTKRSDMECLAAIRFSHLTSISLEGFYLKEGAFLLTVIKHSPKLERIHLGDSISSIFGFAMNLRGFLRKAQKLKDFRLKLDRRKKIYVSHVLDMLNEFKLIDEPKIERISLKFTCETYPTDDYLMLDFLVNFTLEMKHLSCLSLSLERLDPTLIQQVLQRIKEEVLPTRPSLWFHLDNAIPDAADSSVPKVHYHEMIYTNYFDPPPKF